MPLSTDGLALGDLTSEELEEQVFGPDPDRKRRRRAKRGRRGRRTPTPARPVAEVDARAEICPRCGGRQPEAAFRAGHTGGGGRSKGTATVLALVLGGVGGHRFYLGHWKLGLAMLALCWTALPVLVGVVDFLRFAYMSDRQFGERYGKEAPPLLVPPRPVRRLERGTEDAA